MDLILATHFHDDHFSPGPVRHHLLANPEAVLVSTPQAIGRLKPDEDRKLAGRVVAVYPPEDKIEVREFNGVRVEVLNLHHGRDRKPPVQNLGFVIHIGGRRVLHVGDTEAAATEFSSFGLAENPVDLALLPSWFLVSTGDWQTAVKQAINPRAVGAMHIAEKEAPVAYFGRHRSLEGQVRQIKENFPQAEVFTRETRQRVY